MSKLAQHRSTFRKVITLLASVIIFSHLVICTIIIINPGRTVFNSKFLTRVYRYYALPAPYFNEDLIKLSPHFYISGKKNRLWQPWQNPEDDNFKLFHKSYQQYDRLKQSYIERNLAGNFSRRVLAQGDSAFIHYLEFKILHKYFYNEYFKEPADSIRLLYTTTTYKPRERKTKTDTLFYLKYKP